MNGVDIQQTFGSPFENVGQLVSTLLPNLMVFAGVIFFGLMIGGGL